jgi:hypothetical protein
MGRGKGRGRREAWGGFTAFLIMLGGNWKGERELFMIWDGKLLPQGNRSRALKAAVLILLTRMVRPCSILDTLAPSLTHHFDNKGNGNCAVFSEFVVAPVNPSADGYDLRGLQCR